MLGITTNDAALQKNMGRILYFKDGYSKVFSKYRQRYIDEYTVKKNKR